MSIIRTVIKWFGVVVFIAACLLFLTDASRAGYRFPQFTLTQGTTYYVSKDGSNLNGRNWADAWTELDQIEWTLIQPGDTILLDGGTNRMVYEAVLDIQASGTEMQPITIKASDEVGHNGQVVIFGGRSTPLPYCNQAEYVYQTEGVRAIGIIIEDRSWIRLEGGNWRGIAVHGFNNRGMRIIGDSANIAVRNLEIYDNGSAQQNANGLWETTIPGVGFGGQNITFERVIIHDNGQDAFQSNLRDRISNFVLRESWLYNGRRHPSNGMAFNEPCTHTDGIQIYSGDTTSGLTIEDSFVGPGFTQGIILGQRDTGQGFRSVVNDVVLRNVVFAKASGINISGYPGVKSQNWTLDHVTSHCITGYTGSCFWLEGDGHSVTNSIFFGSKIDTPDGIDQTSGNCQYDLQFDILGERLDPQFTNAQDDPLSVDDYTLLTGSPCQGKGSRITTIEQLLALPTDETTPTPTATETTTPQPSASVTATPTDMPSPTATATPEPSTSSTVTPTAMPSPTATGTPTPTPTSPSSTTTTPPPTLPTSEWEAESGAITDPFRINNGIVSQPLETNGPLSGGKASYQFYLNRSGIYIVHAIVNAPTGGANSFYINMDAEPIDPIMIWDIFITDGLEERTVSWRGTGTFDENEFSPKEFTLAKGVHEMILRGREGETGIDRIWLERVGDFPGLDHKVYLPFLQR
ncbi:hypothetical protein KFU94_49060 [Chloroflexi bacterium TSY]|nr:hypothetical protein [Chloroflexi bacterium TSY]